MLAQGWAVICYQAKQLAKTPNCIFLFHENELGVRQAPLDRSIQKLAPIGRRSNVLYLAHLSTLACHPGEPRMYDLLHREYYWSSTSADFYDAAQFYTDCHILDTKFFHQHSLELFLPSTPLQFVAIDTSGPLLRIGFGNKFMIIITNKYIKLTWTLRTTKIQSTQVPNTFSTTGLSLTVSPALSSLITNRSL